MMKYPKRKVWQFSDTGKFIKEYESILSAAKKVGGHDNNILKAIRKKIKSAGYYWRYAAGERPLHIPVRKFKAGRGVKVFKKRDVYNGTGNVTRVEKDFLLTVCVSVPEASALTKVSVSRIRRNCTGETLYSGVYIFEYTKD